MTILAKPEIIKARAEGRLLIEPFDPRNVKNSSYDLTLGDHFYVETTVYQCGRYDVNADPARLSTNLPDGRPIINPYDEASVERMWEHVRAEPCPWDLPGIPMGTPVRWLAPGRSALAHTHEFIGAVDKRTTTMAKARSTVGRNLLEICKCAGWGDIGYANRWTLEITNNSINRWWPLIPGRRIGQLVYLDTTGLDDEQDSYEVTGKYQRSKLAGKTFEELLATWKPEDMLPRMFEDREAL